MTKLIDTALTRRQFVTGVALTTGASLVNATPHANVAYTARPELTGQSFRLDIGYKKVNFTGKQRSAFAINGSIPAPLLRWREGETVTLDVHNHLAVESSIHWHGITLPSNMGRSSWVKF